MGTLPVSQKQTITLQPLSLIALYTSLLSPLITSSGRKRRFFVAGIMATIGAYTSLQPTHSYAVRHTSPASHSITTAALTSNTFAIQENTFSFLSVSYIIAAYIKGRELYLRHSLALRHAPYSPFCNIIRGSP